MRPTRRCHIMEGPHMSSGTEFSRWSSLSSRIGALIAVLLIVSALATATYSASVAHTTASQSSEAAMANAHESTGVLISQAYDEQQRFRATMLEQRKKPTQEHRLAVADCVRSASCDGGGWHHHDCAGQRSRHEPDSH